MSAPDFATCILAGRKPRQPRFGCESLLGFIGDRPVLWLQPAVGRSVTVHQLL
jgi:hypothetical protein